MALPDSNISTTLVGQTLGTSSRDVGTLCTHPNINEWSRYKPVRLSQTSTAMGSHPFLGANIPQNENSLLLSYKDAQWVYERPRGVNVYNEPYRLGDFRNYEHGASYSAAPFGVRYSDIWRKSDYFS